MGMDDLVSGVVRNSMDLVALAPTAIDDIHSPHNAFA